MKVIQFRAGFSTEPNNFATPERTLAEPKESHSTLLPGVVK